MHQNWFGGQGERDTRARWVVWALLAVSGAAPVWAETLQPGIVTTDGLIGGPYPLAINLVVGADRFYTNGYYGYTATIANVEAGHIWDGHEMLTGRVAEYINDPSIDGTTRQYDYHATAVGGILAGLGPPNVNGQYYYYQMGMAPASALWSAAIASSWNTDGSFNTTDQAFSYAYSTAMQTGQGSRLLQNGNTLTIAPYTADVINSSWGFDDPTGSNPYTIAIDGLAYQNHQTVVRSAGNGGAAPVSGAASGYNGISVGALAGSGTTPPYSTLAGFSSTGPNDFYNPQTGVTVTGVRHGVDIVAPGTDMALPAYLGTTGTNTGGALLGSQSKDPSPTDLYFTQMDGTSFASPTVAGGAALVVDAGYQNFGGGAAIDGRVVKAVLLNSATKTVGWTDHPTGPGGVWTTTAPLDFNVGSGALNLNQAYDQYLSGTTNLIDSNTRTSTLKGGSVAPVGWVFGHVDPNLPNDYFITTPVSAGKTLAATLDWFVDRSFSSTPDTVNGIGFTATDIAFDNLYLQLWSATNLGVPTTLLAQSISNYDNVQQIYFTLPGTGYYDLRVLWAGRIYDLGETGTGQDFGLAWSVGSALGVDAIAVPEPATLALLGLPLLLLRRRPARGGRAVTIRGRAKQE